MSLRLDIVDGTVLYHHLHVVITIVTALSFLTHFTIASMATVSFLTVGIITVCSLVKCLLNAEHSEMIANAESKRTS